MNIKSIYRQIQKEYEQERSKNELKAEKRLNELYTKLPSLKEINRELKADGIKLTKQMLLHAPQTEVQATQNDIARLRDKKKAALASLGLTPDYLAPIYTCEKCKDTGYIGSNKCECMKKKLVDKCYDISNLKNILQFENFDNFNLDHYSTAPFEGKAKSPYDNMAAILEDVLSQTELDSDRYFNFYFYGASGLGKTFMCSCIAKKLLDNGKTVIYMTAAALTALIEKNRFHRDELDDDDEAFDMLFQCDLLIIDDLGTEAPTAFTAAEIFNIINTRLTNKKSCVISSNLAPNKLAAQYSDRVVSRIIGSYKIHEFYGSDIRIG